jgi:hypothetical protein
MRRELRLATKDDSFRFCAFSPFARPRSDKFSLELGETAQDGQHQATMRRRSVSPSISQRFEPRPFLGDRPKQIEKIACGPRQSIETGDDQNIPLCQARHQARKLLAVGPRTADLLLKNLGAFGGFEFG